MRKYNKKRKTESGKRKTFLFFDFRLEWKTEPTTSREQRMLAFYAEARRRKSLRSRIKAENGKLFCFSIFAWSGKWNAAIEPRAE